MKKCWLLIWIIAGVFSFLIAETTEEDALILAKKYESLRQNFLVFLEDLGAASEGDDIVLVIDDYILNNEDLFAEIDSLSKPFLDGDRTYRLDRSMTQAQEALDRMPETVQFLEPHIGEQDVRDAWSRFLLLFGIERTL